MLKKSICILIVVCAVFYIVESLIQCTDDFCDSVTCEKDLKCTKQQIIKKHGSTCGCCDICYTVIGENERCPNKIIVGGPPPTEGCAKGLICENGICKKKPDTS